MTPPHRSSKRRLLALRVVLVCCVWALTLAKEGDDVKHLEWLESAAVDLPEEPFEQWPNGPYISRLRVRCDDCSPQEWKGTCSCQRECRCAAGQSPHPATFKSELDAKGKPVRTWRIRQTVGPTGELSNPTFIGAPPYGETPPPGTEGETFSPQRLPRSNANDAQTVKNYDLPSGRRLSGMPGRVRRRSHLLAYEGATPPMEEPPPTTPRRDAEPAVGVARGGGGSGSGLRGLSRTDMRELTGFMALQLGEGLDARLGLNLSATGGARVRSRGRGGAGVADLVEDWAALQPPQVDSAARTLRPQPLEPRAASGSGGSGGTAMTSGGGGDASIGEMLASQLQGSADRSSVRLVPPGGAADGTGASSASLVASATTPSVSGLRVPPSVTFEGHVIKQCACDVIRCNCEQQCNECYEITLADEVKKIKQQITLVWRQQFELPWWERDWHHHHGHHFLWGRRRPESWTAIRAAYAYENRQRAPHSLDLRANAIAQHEPLVSEGGSGAWPQIGDSAGDVIWLKAPDGGRGGHTDAVKECASRLRAPLCRRRDICPGVVNLKVGLGKGPGGQVRNGYKNGDQWVATLDDAPSSEGNLVQVGGKDGRTDWPACLLWSEILQLPPASAAGSPAPDQNNAEQLGNGLRDPASICNTGHCAYVACCPTEQPPLGTWNYSALTALRINTLWRKAQALTAQFPTPSDPKMAAEQKKMARAKYLLSHQLPADAPLPEKGFKPGTGVRLDGQRGSCLYLPGTYPPLQQWTIEFWIRPSTNNRYQHVLSIGRSWWHMIQVHNRGERNTWEIEINTYGWRWKAHARFATRAGKWTHVALSVYAPNRWWYSGKVFLYLDGQLSAARWVWPSPYWALGGMIAFGHSYHQPGWWLRWAVSRRWHVTWYQWWLAFIDWIRWHPWFRSWFAGSIDEVRIWGVRRSHRQIWYNRWRSMYGRAHADLIGYWPLDQQSSYYNRWSGRYSGDESLYRMAAVRLYGGARFRPDSASPLVAHEANGWESEYEAAVLHAPPGRSLHLSSTCKVRLPYWRPWADEWTVELWVRLTTKSEMWSRLWEFGGRRAGAKIFFTPRACCGRGFGLWGRYGSSDPQWHTVSSNVEWSRYNEWVHLAVTVRREGGSQVAKVIVDGVEVASGSFPVTMKQVVRARNYLGSWSGAPQVDGLVDEFRVWGYPRSAEGLALASQRTMLGTEAGLLLYLRFDEEKSAAQFDWSRHNLVAYIYGQGKWSQDTPPHLLARWDGWLARNNSDECPHECNGKGKCVDWQCVCDEGYAGADCNLERWRWTCGYEGATELVECTGPIGDVEAALCVVPPVRDGDGLDKQWCTETRRPPHECRGFRRTNVRWLQAMMRWMGFPVGTDGLMSGLTKYWLSKLRAALGQGPSDGFGVEGIKPLLRKLPAMREGEVGHHVNSLRVELGFKYNTPGLSTGRVDYNAFVRRAVASFQQEYELRHSSVTLGEVGTLTWAALLSQCKFRSFESQGGAAVDGGDPDSWQAAASGGAISDTASNPSEDDAVSPSPPPPSPPQGLANTDADGPMPVAEKSPPGNWWWWRAPADAECGFRWGGICNKTTPQALPYAGWPPLRHRDEWEKAIPSAAALLQQPENERRLNGSTTVRS